MEKVEEEYEGRMDVKRVILAHASFFSDPVLLSEEDIPEDYRRY